MNKLLNLDLTSFRSWCNLHLYFESMGNLILLKGLNGSGKTSIRYALEILFTGSTIDNIPVDELSYNKTGYYKIACNLLIDDKEVRIINERTKNKPSITYFINGNPIPEKTDVRETQKDIIKLLGLDRVDLNSSTIFSTNSLSFPELADSNRKSLIYSVLDLNRYNDYLAKVKEELKELKDKIDKYNNKIATSEGITESQKDELLVYRIKSNSFEEDREDELYHLTKKFDEISNELKEHKSNVKDIDDNITQLYYKIEEVDTSELDKEFFEIEKNIAVFNTQKHATLQSIENLGDDTCPILKERCDLISKNIEEIRNDYKADLIHIDNNIINSEEELNRLNKEIYNLNEIKLKNDLVTDRIDTFKYDKIEIESEVYRLEVQKENIETNITETKEKENVYTGLIEDCLKLITEREKTINRLSSAVDKLKENGKYYKVLEVAFGKSGIPNRIADGFLAGLEFETNRILSSCSDSISVSIDSLTEKKDKSFSEKISYKVNLVGNEISDYRSFSGGQRQRIKIANLMAFNSLLSNFNFLIIDEVLDTALDIEGKSDVTNILKSSNIEHIIVISHDTQLQDIFDEIMKIEIEEEVSVLK